MKFGNKSFFNLGFLSLWVIVLVGTVVQQGFATHNRAGEITFVQTGPLTIRATITTYTKESSESADRDSLYLSWGDGTGIMVGRANGNGNGVSLGNDIKYNIYEAVHTYAARASYTLSMVDPNRNAGILNVNPPNSENIPFYLETTFSFLNEQFQGYNNSATLLQPPIDKGCTGFTFIHNPNASDIDRDSLAYELIIPRQGEGIDVPNYRFPDQILPGADNTLSLDPVSGSLVWMSPQLAGEYNIAILVKEYRNGVLIVSMIRDMQITISNCNNRPPVVKAPDNLCVVVGQTVSFEVEATDLDVPVQRIKLTALGGPFDFSSNPAQFTVPDTFSSQPVKGIFTWTPHCDDISKEYYTVVFRAEDNAFGTSGSSTLHTMRIKVIGPAPEDLNLRSTGNNMEVTWQQPYDCEITNLEFFRGFNVWRKEQSNSFDIDTCHPTMLNKGYVKIAFGIKQIVNNRYQFIDQNLGKGKSYCYRIEAEFAKLTPSGFPYNNVTSLPSIEHCHQLNTDIPMITKVSVVTTEVDGNIEVNWTKPYLPDFDTLAFPGPYTYQLARGIGLNPSSYQDIAGAVYTTLFFNQAVDTSYLDQHINTINQPYTYIVKWSTGAGFYGQSAPSSSVFLQGTGSDRSVLLHWDANVPWSNRYFSIFKENNTGTFDSIGISYGEMYVDRQVQNGVEYCYLIRSSGEYDFQRAPKPILNFSQRICAIPIDSVPPCPPILSVVNDCGSTSGDIIYENRVRWDNPDHRCGILNDTRGYKMYFATTADSEYEVIFETNDPEELYFNYLSEISGLQGCFYVTAFDSLGNESLRSNVVCKENCPDYQLPNTFTPNQDGHNDVFKPFPYRFVYFIEFQVFNRWGNLIFETNDPAINWNGKNKQGSDVPDGTYFFNCKVYDGELTSLKLLKVLTGYIEIIR